MLRTGQAHHGMEYGKSKEMTGADFDRCEIRGQWMLAATSLCIALHYACCAVPPLAHVIRQAAFSPAECLP